MFPLAPAQRGDVMRAPSQREATRGDCERGVGRDRPKGRAREDGARPSAGSKLPAKCSHPHRRPSFYSPLHSRHWGLWHQETKALLGQILQHRPPQPSPPGWRDPQGRNQSLLAAGSLASIRKKQVPRPSPWLFPLSRRFFPRFPHGQCAHHHQVLFW